jgi:hypothetical protein
MAMTVPLQAQVSRMPATVECRLPICVFKRVFASGLLVQITFRFSG